MAREYQLEANIYQLPKSTIDVHDDTLTIGDIHCNLFKLLNFLLITETIIISEVAFVKLKQIFFLPTEQVTHDSIRTLQDALAEITLISRSRRIRFLGDMFADRVGNDWWMFLLLQRLYSLGLRYEIILSNHDCEMIKHCESKLKEIDVGIMTPEERSQHIFGKRYFMLPEGPVRPDRLTNYVTSKCASLSFYNLASLIMRGLVTERLVLEVYKTVYRPYVRLFAVDLCPLPWEGERNQRAGIYTHAVSNLNTIRMAANYYGLGEVDLSNTESIAVVVQKINAELQARELLLPPELIEQVNSPQIRSFFVEATWSRAIPEQSRSDQSLEKSALFFVNGHNESRIDHRVFRHGKSQYPLRADLDNGLGKSTSTCTGIGELRFLSTSSKSFKPQLRALSSLYNMSESWQIEIQSKLHSQIRLILLRMTSLSSRGSKAYPGQDEYHRQERRLAILKLAVKCIQGNESIVTLENELVRLSKKPKGFFPCPVEDLAQEVIRKSNSLSMPNPKFSAPAVVGQVKFY